MSRHTVASAEDVGPGERVIVQLAGREIAVMNVDGAYHAVLNWCPHQAGPLCEGELSGTVDATYDRETLTTTIDWVREGYIVACPWHGWEFDVTTGESVFNPHRWSVGTYETDVIANPEAVESGDCDPAVETHPVDVEDGGVVVYV
jgi:nitrite reductase/ring-hydroxylating ferredoxin subunit